MFEMKLPQLVGDVNTSTLIVNWLKKEGDEIKQGEPIVVVETAKTTIEVESPKSGILYKILVLVNQEAKIGENIAVIADPSEKGIKISDSLSAPGLEPQDLGKKRLKKIKSNLHSDRINISPLARKIAINHGIDYTNTPIKGTGSGGRITKDDINAYLKSTKKTVSKENTMTTTKQAHTVSTPAVTARKKSSNPLKGMRKVVAERLTYSKQNIPHIILTSVMEVSALVALHENIKDKVLNVYDAKLTYTDFIIKACATVLEEQPVINSSLQDNNHIIYDEVNIGLAVSVEGGLIVPTVYGADELSLFDITKSRAELIDKARRGKLAINEISNGTFTISNLGMFGVRNFTAIINPPQGAILMVGEIYREPAVDNNDNIKIKKFMQISIAVDHRIIDGADASRFLKRLKEILENPELLLILEKL